MMFDDGDDVDDVDDGMNMLYVTDCCDSLRG